MQLIIIGPWKMLPLTAAVVVEKKGYSQNMLCYSVPMLFFALQPSIN